MDDMTSKIALLDMDGTICDFDSAMNAQLELLRGGGEPKVTYERDHEPSYIKARRRLIKNQPGFWLGLEKLWAGFTVLGMLKKLDFEIHILTRASHLSPGAWNEKVQWCRTNVPNIPITITQEKSLMYGKVLVDDYPGYIVPWIKHRPRGLVLMPDQPWNKDFPESDNVIRFDGIHDQARIYEALEKVRNAK